MKISKAGKPYCSQLCWKNEPGYQEKPQGNYQTGGDGISRMEFDLKMEAIRNAFKGLEDRIKKLEKQNEVDIVDPDAINIDDIPFG